MINGNKTDKGNEQGADYVIKIWTMLNRDVTG